MALTSSTLGLFYAKYRIRIFLSLLLILAYYLFFIRRPRKKASERIAHEIKSEMEVWDAMSDFKDLDPIAFEKLSGEIIKHTGYRIIENGELTKDGGIDLIAENAVSLSLVGIQCKKYYREPITLKEMREFYGALCANGYKRGIYVTLKGYTQDAMEFALDHNIDTWDAVRLKQTAREHLSNLSDEALKLLESKIHFCRRCDARMTLKRARRGRTAGKLYWACTERECRKTSNF